MDPEASQENLKRPEKAPKRHPKRHPKVVQKLVKQWSKREPKNEQKGNPKMSKKVALTAPPLERFWTLKTVIKKLSKNSDLIFGNFFEQFWNHFGAHFVTRSAKEGAR